MRYSRPRISAGIARFPPRHQTSGAPGVAGLLPRRKIIFAIAAVLLLALALAAYALWARSGKTTASTEKVYVPGQSTGSGTPQGNAGTPGSGTDSQLVPYTDYLSEYRSAAQSEVDRQLIPPR